MPPALDTMPLFPPPTRSTLRQMGQQYAMGLSHNKPRYNKALRTLRKFVNEHLDVTKMWHEQDEAMVALYTLEASKADKLLTLYEASWPAVYYAKKRLRRLQQRRNQPGRGSSEVIEIDESTDGEEPHRDDEDVNTAPHLVPVKPRKNMASKLKVSSQSIQASTSQLPSVSGSSNQDSSVAGSSIIASMSAFRSYLDDLDPVLARHFEQLWSAGINCEDHLKLLLGFPWREKERFLLEHCDIKTPIQAFDVCLALEKARAKLSVDIRD
ncbi:uncharacterized protein PHACADRAFT_205795 [Phanerochaete carnosa HHB-10118-sp]|uniref:Uncharacterized protein n=1 Tax=Phanerochaete carnosa (strain HHB-10118-sp) TaxID=650164 RepID=K5X9J8_PHACS|nr:uncharacterized protein PHACADRAFT_205795 [Phanerochaete carnosa HHB-10118-sp]EKM59577.1 hypothetical protein PHACADRAFT_205795 [Phanerochaete carnosa HHB-10118-sp]